jgi:hypothetical protein
LPLARHDSFIKIQVEEPLFGEQPTHFVEQMRSGTPNQITFLLVEQLGCRLAEAPYRAIRIHDDEHVAHAIDDTTKEVSRHSGSCQFSTRVVEAVGHIPHLITAHHGDHLAELSTCNALLSRAPSVLQDAACCVL